MTDKQNQNEIGRTIWTALISGTVAATLIGGVLTYHLNRRAEEFRTQRSYDLAVLTELVAPAVMLLSRSDAAAKRYRGTGNQYFGDAAILYDANLRMRELLLTKAHLMSPELMEPSKCLLVHYDLWLRRFDSELAEYKEKNNELSPKPDDRFDVGYASLTHGAGKCGEFPEDVPAVYEKEKAELKLRLSK